MNRLALSLIALFLLICDASAATCTWSGGTGAWDNSNTASWSCGHVPTTSDTAVFDGTSGGGTVTVNSPNAAGAVTVQAITCGAFTGTLDFSANNNNVTLTAVTGLNNNGTGTRTINLGSGTWTFTGVATTLINTNTTGLTLSAASAALVFTATTATTRGIITGNSKSYGSITVSANTSGGNFIVTGSTSVTFSALSVVAPNAIQFPNGTTTVITGAISVSGSSSNQVLFQSNASTGQTATISSANNGTFTWSAFKDVVFTGGGTFTASNSFNLGNNTGITITTPVTAGPNIIGGWLFDRDLPANDNFMSFGEKAA